MAILSIPQVLDTDHIMWNETGMRSEKNYMIYITANCVCEFRIIIFATKTAPEELSRPELVIQLLTSLTSVQSLKDFSLNYMHSM